MHLWDEVGRAPRHEVGRAPRHDLQARDWAASCPYPRAARDGRGVGHAERLESGLHFGSLKNDLGFFYKLFMVKT